jgi:hypothetical protein
MRLGKRMRPAARPSQFQGGDVDKMTQATDAPAGTRAQISEKTLRRDPWWREPAITAALLVIWVAYATVHVFLGRWYWVPRYHYLTPFYSPCVSGACAPGSSSLGHWFGDVPSIIPYAVVSLPFVLGFRLTCYYYRKAYYRSFWLSPPACAVAEPHKKYSGETRFPLIWQNIHRYFLYLALIVNVILFIDAVFAFRNEDGEWGHMSVGTLVLLVNAILLLLYSLSCHSCRHIVGGRLNTFSRHPARYWMWNQVSKLNVRHMPLAWVSMIGVALADLYVLLVARGTISNPYFF